MGTWHVAVARSPCTHDLEIQGGVHRLHYRAIQPHRCDYRRDTLTPGTHLSAVDCPTLKDNFEQMLNQPYMELVGALAWLALGTRPDIALATNSLARFGHNLDASIGTRPNEYHATSRAPISGVLRLEANPQRSLPSRTLTGEVIATTHAQSYTHQQKRSTTSLDFGTTKVYVAGLVVDVEGFCCEGRALPLLMSTVSEIGYQIGSLLMIDDGIAPRSDLCAFIYISSSDSDGLADSAFPRSYIIIYIVYLGLYPQVPNTYTAFPHAEPDYILRLSATRLYKGFGICSRPQQTRLFSSYTAARKFLSGCEEGIVGKSEWTGPRWPVATASSN